jgi:hypothetical protein
MMRFLNLVATLFPALMKAWMRVTVATLFLGAIMVGGAGLARAATPDTCSKTGNFGCRHGQ